MLSDVKARKAGPGERDYKLADEKGLHLLVRPNGSKLWRMKYRHAGKEKLLSFGAYPEVTLAEARERRDAARAMIRDGRDPAIEKKRAAVTARSKAAHTFESVAREWHDLQADRWTPIHTRDVLHSLERDIFPSIGALPISEIDAPLLLDVLRKVERRGAVETAKRLRQRISGVFVYAISQGIARDDPAAIVTKALKPIPKRRRQPAVVDLAELRGLLAKTDEGGAYPVTLLASRLLALTVVRPGVVRGARWDEVRLHERGGPVWHIPAARMKLSLERKDEAAFDHVVPLSPQAVEVFEAVRRLSGKGELVFPGQRHAHTPLSENAIGYLYNRAGWHGRHVPHGWRAAFSTIMNERAQVARRPDDRAIIDLMLAHIPENEVESAYNRAQFNARRREIAQEWADLLLEGAVPADALLELGRRASR
jgi:integrase